MSAAKKAASIASRIAKEGRKSDLSITTKSIGDYVSEIDLRIDKEISLLLKSAFPELKIVSEELSPDFEALPEDCWIVDPLDGTNSYLANARLELVSTMIALRLGGKTVCSLVHFPFTEDTYVAVKGEGAFRNGETVSMPKGESLLSDSWVAMNHYGDQTLETDFFTAMRDGLRSRTGAFMITIDPPGSGLALGLTDSRNTLRAVVHDNNPTKRKQEVWDVIPIQLIIEEAGGVYLNDALEPYDPQSVRPIIIASSMKLARDILRAGSMLD